MTLSAYLASLRSKVGHDLLLLPAVAVVLRDASGLVEARFFERSAAPELLLPYPKEVLWGIGARTTQSPFR